MERVQIEPARVVVDQLFDPAHGLAGRVQSKDHRTHARHVAGQVQLDHLRIHVVPQVAIVVQCVAVVRALEEHMHFGRAGESRRLYSQADRREVQTDQRTRVLEPVDLHRRKARVVGLHQEDSRGVAQLVEQLHRHIRMDVRGPGRLLFDNRLLT